MVYQLKTDLVYKVNDYMSYLFPKDKVGLSYVEAYKNPATKTIHLEVVVASLETGAAIQTITFGSYNTPEEYAQITSIFNSDGTLTEAGLEWALDNVFIQDTPLRDILEVEVVKE